MKTQNTLMLAVMCMALITTPGCDKAPSKQQILTAVRIGGKEGTQLGFRELAKKNPNAAVEAATKLRRNIDEQILPYLKGEGKLSSSALIQDFINSSLFKEIHPDVKMGVVAASMVLDLYLPAPSVNGKLSADQIEYMVAFFTGVRDGCELSQDKGMNRVWLK